MNKEIKNEDRKGFFKNVKISRLFYNNKFCVFFSIFAAVILWFFVALSVTTTTTQTIYNVEVNIPVENNILSALDLEVVESTPKTVTVTVSGPRLTVSNLKAKDIVVKANIADVNNSGTYNLKLEVSELDVPNSVKIENISPSIVEVTFDRVDAKSFPITVDTSGVGIETDYISEKETTNIEEVVITGAANKIDKIDKVVAKIEPQENKLTKTKDFIVDLQVFDKQGNAIEGLDLSEKQVTVTIPVFMKKRIPIKVTFENPPAAYAAAPIPYTITSSGVVIEYIDVKAPEDVFDTFTEITLGPIDFKDITIGSKMSFDLINYLPKSVKFSDSSIVSVTVEPNTSNMATKTMAVTRFSIINSPAGISASVITTKIDKVTIIGPKNVLDSITADNLTAVIDLKNQAVIEGESEIKISSVEVNGRPNCWGIGEYAVFISVKKMI